MLLARSPFHGIRSISTRRIIDSIRNMRSALSQATEKSTSDQTTAAQCASPTAKVRKATSTLISSTRERTRQHFGRASPEQCASSCDELLRRTVRTPHKTYRRAGLYTIELAAPADPAAPVLVLTHGYGVGGGLWCYLLDLLAPHFHVFSVDWLGCGASDRPQWPSAARTPRAAESFFIDSFAAWVEATAEAQAPFALVGHSLGGYLSSAYVMSHPGRVAALALLSPAGLSGASAPPPAPTESRFLRAQARFRSPLFGRFSRPRPPAAPSPPLATAGRPREEEQQQQLSEAQRRHWAVRTLTRAWDAGVTPQAIVRGLGSWGEAWTGRVLSRRFDEAAKAHFMRQRHPLWQGARGAQGRREERSDAVEEGLGPHSPPPQPEGAGVEPHAGILARYLYQITAAPGSGEHALSRLLVFGGAHARDAMAPRLVAAATAAAAEASPRGASGPPFPVSVTVLYGGTHDWMPAQPGFDLALHLRLAGVDALAGLTPHSGHHLHMESPVAVAQVLQARMVPAVAAALASRQR